MSPDLTQSVAWMREGTQFAVGAARRAVAEPGAPSLLPGWDVAHVLAHTARNADALARLLRWAATGVETPMYPGRAERDAEIDLSAQQSGEALLADVVASASVLDGAVTALDPQAWSNEVRTVSGRTIQAREVPWMRAKEVWWHAVDIGADPNLLPDELVDASLDEVCAQFTDRPEAPSLTLVPTDRTRPWQIGAGAGSVVQGSAVDLLTWLVGRADGARLLGELPQLPPWL